MADISKDLIAKAAQGDMGAFEEIYKATSGFVYNVALRITNDRSDADEATQDTFVKVHRNLKGFGFRSSFKTWVYRIAANTALNHIRRVAKHVSGRATYDPAVHDRPAAPDVTGAIDRQDARHLLEAMLGTLDPDQRACLVLREIQGLDYQAIADTLKININTVRSRLKRAREKLLAFGGKG
ncbi:MAG: RNA polymerase sigma factor [Candidatus Omnitrophica bacterium]|nr:RNA polymerase sigma factor [Candidatus Omnitrophota bacterium]